MKAMKSLRLYPLAIESEEEALRLDGVGKMIAKDIMIAINPNYYNDVHCNVIVDTTTNPAEPSGIIPKRNKMYKPESGKGPWLVLKSLHHIGNVGSRQDIIIACREHLNINISDDVYKNAMKTLRDKDLVDTSNKSRLSLTSMGIEVAKSLQGNSSSRSSNNSSSSSASSSSSWFRKRRSWFGERKTKIATRR